MIPQLKKALVLGALLTLVLGLLLVLVPANATASVKSETITISKDTDFSFTLQLKEEQKVYWEWTANLSSPGENETAIVNFTITDPDDDNLVSVSGKSADKGDALVPEQGIHEFRWGLAEGEASLAYTITYEAYTGGRGLCCVIGIIAAAAGLGACLAVFIRKRPVQDS